MHTNRQTKGHRQNNRGIQTSGQRDTDRTTRIQTGKQRDTDRKKRRGIQTDRQTEGHTRQTEGYRQTNRGTQTDKDTKREERTRDKVRQRERHGQTQELRQTGKELEERRRGTPGYNNQTKRQTKRKPWEMFASHANEQDVDKKCQGFSTSAFPVAFLFHLTIDEL